MLKFILWELYCKIILVAEALNLSKIIIGGWSLGGMVAQIVTTEYPQNVSHAVLIGTTPPGKNQGVSEKIFIERKNKTDYDLDDEYMHVMKDRTNGAELKQ